MSKTDLGTKTKVELLKMAQKLGLRGISTMNKAELADTISRAHQQSSGTTARQPMGVAAVAQRVAQAVKRRAVRKRDLVAAPALTTVEPKTSSKAHVARESSSPGSSAEEQAGAAAAKDHAAHKFDVTPQPSAPRQDFREEHLGDLPESYGTGKLFLTARDPHWLFAYWDLNPQQMADFRQQSADGRVLLRVFEKNHRQPIHELPLQNDSRNWYIPVNKAATTYSTELGFWRRDGSFHSISRSREATTPPETVSPETTARFVTIPIDLPFATLLNLIRGHMHEGEQLAEAMHRLQASGFKFPFQVGIDFGPWSEEQATQLERMLGGDRLRRMQTGSFEISEWLRRRLQEELSSGMFSAFSPAGSSWQAGAPQHGFWFAVNAELIIYGATEPDAKVTIDGKSIALRKDGTFSFHYTFPDGQYRMPVVAVSARGDDQRAVELQFQRKTATKGDVGKVRQPAHLKPPQTAK